eukprot:gene14054-15515_t
MASRIAVIVAVAFLSGLTAQEGPQVVYSPSIVIKNTTFTISYQLPSAVFRDKEDGNTRNLSLYLYYENGDVIPRTSWISLKLPEQMFRIYSSKAIFDSQPIGGYKFKLSAIDSSGREGHTTVTVTFNGPINPANYLTHLKLSSINSVLVNSYKDVDVLFLLQSKLATYLNIKVFNIVNEKLNVTRYRNSLLTIEYTFSIPRLIGQNCNVNRIIGLRSYLHGNETEKKLREAMQPQFSFTQASKEEFQLACGYLSGEPPVIGSQFKTQNIQVSQYFSFSISQSLFSTPPGSNMRLSLQLRFGNNTKVASNFWIGLNGSYIDENVKLHGLVDLSMAGGQHVHSFKLVALTPLLMESYQNIQFNLESSMKNVSYTIVMTQYSIVTASYITVARSFVSYMSTYLSVAESTIIITSYKITATTTILSWTLSTLSQSSCDLVKIKEINQKLTTGGGVVNDIVRNGLYQSAVFAPTSVFFKPSAACDRPTINYKIPMLFIPQYGPLMYQVPISTFQDGSGGLNFNMSLLDEQGHPLGPTSWIWFNSTSRFISGLPFLATTTTTNFSFILRAVDRNGFTADQNLTISLNWTAPQTHLAYLVQFSYLPSLLPVSNVVTMFIVSLKAYFQQATASNVIIDQTTFLSNNKMRIYYQNTSLRTAACDVKGYQAIMTKLLQQSTRSTPNPSLVLAMQPLFHVEEVGVKLSGKCLIANRNPPYFNFADFAALSFFRTKKPVSFCDVASYIVPEKLFNDEEDGFTRNLNLHLSDVNHNKLPVNSWVNINATSQTIYAIADDSSYKNGLKSKIFRLVATDSDGKTSNIRMNFTLTNTKPVSYYNITMHLNVMEIDKEPYVLQIASLLKGLKTLFAGGIRIHVHSYSLLNSNNFSSTAVFVWSPCHMTKGECNSTVINLIRYVVFLAGTNTLNSKVNSALGHRFNVSSASEGVSGPCDQNTTVTNVPIVQNSLPILNITSCGYLVYQIPDNTFHDDMDGSTRNLTLALLSSTYGSIAENWIEFNAHTQTLSVVLSDNSLANIKTSSSTLKFKLKATSKRGLFTYADLHMRIDRNRPNATYSIQINFAWIASNPPSQNTILSTFIDKFSTYFGTTASSFRFSSTQRVSGTSYPYFVLQIVNCSAPYATCDHNSITVMESKLNDVRGTLSAFKNAMGTSIFYITYVQVAKFGVCDMKNTPPILVNPLAMLQVHICSDFNYTLPSSTFRDEEDSTLQLSVTKINNIPISSTYNWVLLVPSEHTLHGVVTNEVLQNQPIGGYNLTIRATDSGGLYVETFLLIKIIGSEPQKNYQFSLELKANQIGQRFMEERQILRTLNSYFQSRFANILSYTKSSSNTNIVTVKCGICTLAKKCDEKAALFYFYQMIDSKKNIVARFASAFSYRYNLISVTTHTDPLCQQALNPPVSLVSKWMITADYCGGFEEKVPTNMFNDAEDGNTSNLSLQLYLSPRTSIPSDNWFRFNQTSQTIYGWPTRDEALKLDKFNSSVLVATDKTGLEASVKIEFAFTSHVEPKYIFHLFFHPVITFHNNQIEVKTFVKMLKSFLKDSMSKSMGLIRHTSPITGVHYFDYANCSLSYSPCDIAALNRIKSLLFTQTNVVTTELRNAMISHFTMNYGHAQILPPCSVANNHPPTVTSKITQLNISICGGFYTFRIPANTFYDTEEGNTRKLTLNLRDGNNQQLSLNSWIQFNRTSQTITAYATATLLSSQSISGYLFNMVATDTSQLSALNSFNIKLYGPAKVLKDCQIRITFSTHSSLSSASNNALSHVVLTGLASYFNIHTSNIGLVDFIRQSNTLFTVAWSYCSTSYMKYVSATSSSHIPVDYKGLVTKILMNLFKTDRKTVQTGFYFAFNKLTVLSVQTVFTGSCKNIPPIVALNINKLSYTVPYHGYRKEAIQWGLFYDYEDGYTFNLKLTLLNDRYKSVSNEKWINIDIVSRYLLMSLRDAERMDKRTSFVFYLQATDSGGKNATLLIEITKLQSSSSRVTPFNITFEFTLTYNADKNIFVNESIGLSNVSSQLYNLGGGYNILTRIYTGQSGPFESRTFTWTTHNYQQCSTSSVLQKTRELFDANRKTFTTFKLAFYSLPVTFERFYYVSSCNNPIMPPAPSSIRLQLNITMCTPLRYRLPRDTFVDSVDGEIYNMKVILLDNNKKQLSSNSWIQLNTAKLEIYAIYHSSSSFTSSNEPLSQTAYFQLEATNSQGLKAYKQMQVNVMDYPYTSDCLVTMNVKRQFGSSAMVDIDVLYRLVQTISNFYQDSTINIKVSRFQQMSTFVYSLVFSNCSFVFATKKAALWGLDESHRSSITAIFSRIISADGKAKSPFVAYLSLNGFALTSIQASDSCIESPPYSKVDTLRPYAFLCHEFSDLLAFDLFNDTRDGTNLKLSLRYTNGKEVAISEWVQLDPIKKQIKIANAAPIVHAKFVLGFTSLFNEKSKTADILVNITRKIAKYLNEKTGAHDILVISYNAINSITFEHCKLQCTPSFMSTISQKLQKVAYKPDPSEAFIAAMKPEFSPTYLFIDGDKCIERTNITVVVKIHKLTNNQSVCGLITYNIPSNVFSSSVGETTRQLLLTMKSSSGSSLDSKSIITLRTDIQQVEGVAVYTRLSSLMTYIITAKNSRSTSIATTSLQIKFPDYKTFNSMFGRLCFIKAEVTTSYNPNLSDVYILKKFMQKVANFFNSLVQQIQIISYTRSNTFPIKLTISFSNCTWYAQRVSQTNLGLYYQRINLILKKIFTYASSSITGFTQAFADSLKPDFTLISVTANTTTCTDQPPKPKHPLSTVTAASCGEFNYHIPNDFFSDEDGGTTALKIEFLSSDKSTIKFDSWVIYDNKTQTISGLPLNETLINQPRDGYRYVIKATDVTGKSGFATLIIKVDGKPYIQYADKELTLLYQTTLQTSYQMVKILAITRKVSSFALVKDPKNQLKVISVKFLPSLRMLIKLVNCTMCNPYSMIKFNELAQNQQLLFNQHMKPEFPISSSLSATGMCQPRSNRRIRGVMHNVTFCATIKVDFLKVLSTNQLETGIKLVIKGNDFQNLPITSWFWFNETSSVLEAFPNEDAWKVQPTNGTAFTWALMNNHIGQIASSFVEDSLLINGIPAGSGLQYSLTIDTRISSTNVDAYFVSIIFSSLRAYLGRSDLQLISVIRQQGNDLRLIVKFHVCGLPIDCTTTDVKQFDNKIFLSPGNLRPEFKSIFPFGYNVISVTDNCKDQPPIIPNSLNLTIPLCGLYRYKLPADFASDIEDGDINNLTVSIRTRDNLRLPRDSWIGFNETSKEIYSYPHESIVRTPKPFGWKFIIIVQDKGGKQAETTLTVNIQSDAELYYKLSMSFYTVGSILTTAPYLDIQIKFLQMLSLFTSGSSLSTYRILNFVKTSSYGIGSESYFMQYGICSVPEKLCLKNHKELEVSYQSTLSMYKNIKSQFYIYMSQSFMIASIKNSTSYIIDTAPRVLNKLSIIKLNDCEMSIIDVSSTFYDEVQGTASDLSMTMMFLNGTIPRADYWVQLINKAIYIVPYGSTKSGTYKLILSAKDNCQQTVNTSITIILTSKSYRAPYQLNLFAATTTTTRVQPVFYIAQLKIALKNLFKSNVYQTKVTAYYSVQLGRIEIRFSNCTLQQCDRHSINEIKRVIFVAQNITNPSLISQLQPYFKINRVIEQFANNCKIPSTLPPVANRSLAIQVPICTKLNFSIPIDTFTDPEDGHTRSLSLLLLTEFKEPLGMSNWVQFDAVRQVIYGYPRIGLNKQFRRAFKYVLVASDKEGNSASTTVTITIIGDLPQISYQLLLSGETRLEASIPNVAQEILLIKKIANFFDDSAINDISYQRNINSFQFSWSFCSMRRDKCDCYKIQKVRQQFVNLKLLKDNFQPEFTVINNVKENLHGVCSNTRSPELRHDRNELIIQPGEVFIYDIRVDKFYDYEDGFTKNLTLYIANYNGLQLDTTAWLRIQNFKICGILTLYRSEQMHWLTTTSTTKYEMIARDRCGRETKDSFITRLKISTPKLGYKIILYLRHSLGTNCTKMETFIQKIAEYIKMNKSSILIYDYTNYNSTINTTSSVVTWGIRNLTEMNCRNETIEVIREKFLFQDDRVNPTFLDFMKPDYQVLKVKDEKMPTCKNATIIIPPPIKPIIPWWILILILILAILLLIIWCCWLCIPRCCADRCGTYCGCCAKCCQPGEKYASLQEDGVAGKPRNDGSETAIVKGAEDDDDETMRIPPPYFKTPDPNGRNIGFENDGLDDDDDHYTEPDFDSADNPADDSFDSREEVTPPDNEAMAKSIDSGVIEDEMKQEKATVEETPLKFEFSPPPLAEPPPLYMSRNAGQRSGGRSGENKDDFFADLLAEGRRDDDEFRKSLNFENEIQNDSRDEANDEINDSYNTTSDKKKIMEEYMNAEQSKMSLNSRDLNIDDKDAWMSKYSENIEESIMKRTSNESHDLIDRSDFVFQDDAIQQQQQQLILPQPNLDFNQVSLVSNSDFSLGNMKMDMRNEAKTETSMMVYDEANKNQNQTEMMILPEITRVTSKKQSITRPVEIRMRKDEFMALQFGDNRRRHSVPLLFENSDQLGLLFYDENDNDKREHSFSSTRRSSESNFMDYKPLQMPKTRDFEMKLQEPDEFLEKSTMLKGTRSLASNNDDYNYNDDYYNSHEIRYSPRANKTIRRRMSYKNDIYSNAWNSNNDNGNMELSTNISNYDEDGFMNGDQSEMGQVKNYWHQDKYDSDDDYVSKQKRSNQRKVLLSSSSYDMKRNNSPSLNYEMKSHSSKSKTYFDNAYLHDSFV